MKQPILLSWGPSDWKEMFTPGEVYALKDVKVVGHEDYTNAWEELQVNYESLLLWTSRAWLEDMFQATKVWKKGIPLGADGMFNFVKDRNNNAAIVTFGTKSNYLDPERSEKRQNFRFFGIAVYKGENTTAIVSQYAVYRKLAKEFYGVDFPQVSVWNSDDHVAYKSLRQVCFPKSYFCPCLLHVLRRILEKKDTFRPLTHTHAHEFHTEIDVLRKTGSRDQFKMLTDSFLHYWKEQVENANDTSVKTSAEICQKYLSKVQDDASCYYKTFYAGSSNMPGHVADNQSIESANHPIRQRLGKKKFNLKDFVTEAVPNLVEFLSVRIVKNNELIEMHSHSDAVSKHELAGLQALLGRGDEDKEGRAKAKTFPPEKVSFPRPRLGCICDGYVFPAIRVYDPKTKKDIEIDDAVETNAKRRNYALWTSEVGEKEADYYLKSLDGFDTTPTFKNAHAARMVLGAYVCCRRVQEKDRRDHYPDELWKRIEKNGWICNCLWWARTSCCPHVLLAQALDKFAKGETPKLYDIYTADKFRSKTKTNYPQPRPTNREKRNRAADDDNVEDAAFNSPKRAKRESGAPGKKTNWSANTNQRTYLTDTVFDADKSFPKDFTTAEIATIVETLSGYGSIEYENVYNWYNNKRTKVRKKRELAAALEPLSVVEKRTKEDNDIFDNHEFTQEQNKRIDDILAHKPSTDLLPMVGNMALTYQDVQSLETGKKVRGACINFFFKNILFHRVVRERVEGEAPHFYFFDTFFTDRMLLGDGYKYEKVQKWTNMKANTRDYFPIRCKKLIMPIFYTSAKTVKERREVEDGHWFLAVVDTEKKKVLIFDSLQDSMRDVTEEIGKNLIRWVFDEAKDKLGEKWDTSKWEVEYPEVSPVPRQNNGTDCGIFTMHFARNILSFQNTSTDNYTWTFNQENIPDLRRRCILEICELCEQNGIGQRKSGRILSQSLH